MVRTRNNSVESGRIAHLPERVCSSRRYLRFDRFGRVIQQLWWDYTASEDRDEYSYGYDRNSNRNYRENNVTGDKKDELYGYDNLDRLTSFNRGNLDGDKDEIPTAGGDRLGGEAWGLSATGNCRSRHVWPNFRQIPSTCWLESCFSKAAS